MTTAKAMGTTIAVREDLADLLELALQQQWMVKIDSIMGFCLTRDDEWTLRLDWNAFHLSHRSGLQQTIGASESPDETTAKHLRKLYVRAMESIAKVTAGRPIVTKEEWSGTDYRLEPGEVAKLVSLSRGTASIGICVSSRRDLGRLVEFRLIGETRPNTFGLTDAGRAWLREARIGDDQ